MTKRFIILFIASIALNLFFGGILIGLYLKPSYPPSPRGMFQQVLNFLPTTTQIRVAPLIQKHIEVIKMQEQQIKLIHQEAYKKLLNSHFNPEEFSAILAKLRQERSKMQENMHVGLIEIATQLDLEERKNLAELFKQRHRNFNLEKK